MEAQPVVEYLLMREDYLEERVEFDNDEDVKEFALRRAITTGTTDVIDVYVKIGEAVPKAEWI